MSNKKYTPTFFALFFNLRALYLALSKALLVESPLFDF